MTTNTNSIHSPNFASTLPAHACLSATASGVGAANQIFLIEGVGDSTAHDFSTTPPFTWDVVGGIVGLGFLILMKWICGKLINVELSEGIVDGRTSTVAFNDSGATEGGGGFGTDGDSNRGNEGKKEELHVGGYAREEVERKVGQIRVQVQK